MDRRFDEHSRVQNAHLVSIDTTLKDLGKGQADDRQERAEQIGGLRTDVVERFNKILLTAIGLGIPMVASLLYLILNQALKTP